MLQASDNKSVSQVLPFLGSIADTICGNSSSAVTSLFSMYSDRLCFINLDRQLPYWTCKDLQSLKLNIRTFKKAEKGVITPYQAFGMGSQK